LERLHRRELDLCICYVPAVEPAFACASLGATTLVALVPAEHGFAGCPSVTLADLAAEPLVLFPREENPNLYARFTDAMEATGRRWQLAATALDIENLAVRSLAGMGVAIGLRAATADMHVDGIVAVPIADAPPIEKVLVWRDDEDRRAVLDLIGLIRRTMTE
jgi:DNA-binding transcriptional LysR family regulator